MKARIPLNNSIKRDVERYMQAQQSNVTRRLLKVFLVSLNIAFKFGKKRLNKFVQQFNLLMEEERKNEVFWENIDRILIEQLGLKFEREQLDITDNFKR